MLEEILELYEEDDFLVADGFNEAILGVDETTMTIIYSVKKCIDLLITKQGFSHVEAMEYFSFNVSGAYVGKKTPTWCFDNF